LQELFLRFEFIIIYYFKKEKEKEKEKLNEIDSISKGGVMLGADTRATEGPIVADKNCEKIHYISKNIFCCGAGTAADTENVTSMISSRIELHSLATGRVPRVSTALTMLKQYLFRF